MSSCSSEVASCCVAFPPPYCDSGRVLLLSIRSMLVDIGERFWSLAHSANPKVWGAVAVSGLDLHTDNWSVEGLAKYRWAPVSQYLHARAALHRFS